jgi:hypothetical protein
VYACVGNGLGVTENSNLLASNVTVSNSIASKCLARGDGGVPCRARFCGIDGMVREIVREMVLQRLSWAEVWP